MCVMCYASKSVSGIQICVDNEYSEDKARKISLKYNSYSKTSLSRLFYALNIFFLMAERSFVPTPPPLSLLLFLFCRS